MKYIVAVDMISGSTLLTQTLYEHSAEYEALQAPLELAQPLELAHFPGSGVPGKSYLGETAKNRTTVVLDDIKR